MSTLDPLRPNPTPPRPAPARSPMFVWVQFGLLVLLIYSCARVVMPFLSIILWSAILAVMLYPLHLRFTRRVGNRWSATIIGILGVVVLVSPMVAIATALAGSLSPIITGLQEHTLTLPPPPTRLADVPLVGERITAAWTQAVENTPAMLAKYAPSLRGLTGALVAFVGRLAAAELAFILSFVIAAILIAYGEGVANFSRRLVQVFTNSADRGVRLVALTAATIRGVAVGVVGVAAIQAGLLAIGFFAMGFQAAAVLTFLVLLLGIIQVPATLVTVPVVIYAFATEELAPAAIFAVWTIVAGLSDNALKPLLLGRGLEVPMPVILVGVIGGMVADGILGLFVGPALLAVAYALFVEWLKAQPGGAEAKTDVPAA